jgi:hypothetical protein
MSVGAQMVIMLKAFVEHCVPLVLGHPFEFSWLEVSQTDVFHPFLLVSVVVQFGRYTTLSSRLCHPERSRFSGVAKDLPLNRPNA